MRPLVFLFLFGACSGGDDKAVEPDDSDTLAVDTDETDSEDSETNDPPVGDVVVCPAPPPGPPGDATCEASGSGEAIVVYGTILGESVYVGGAVRVEDGEITCVGCDCDEDGARIVTCGDAVVSPGLINAHDHITFDENPPMAPSDVRYEHRHDWRFGGDPITAPSNEHGVDGVRWTEVRQLLAGTTAILGSGFAPGLVRNLDSGPNIGDGLRSVFADTFPLGDSSGGYRPSCGWRYGSDAFQLQGRVYVPHVAEGINDRAAEEFACMSRPDGGVRDYLTSNASFVQGIALTAMDYARMAEDGAGLIWSPRTSLSLFGHTALVPVLHRLGGRVALGTDWTVTGSSSVLRELACAAEINEQGWQGYFSDEALWRMVTADAAAVLHQPRLGVLAVGMLADIAVFRAESGQTHDAVVRAVPGDVALVMRTGTPLFGDADVVAGLGVSCDAIDVCERPSMLCLSDADTTWSDLQAAVPGAYAAVLCGVPEGEPTCHPSRPGEYDGPTPGDRDGDGIDDATDLCPDHFSPVRPMDEGVQGDADRDGIGDLCDGDPLGTDPDDDAVLAATDNCPWDANDQADGDGDGRGDTCDACPDEPNPVGVCPAPTVTIAEARAGEVPDDGRVVVEGVVTAIEPGQGFWIQEAQTAGLRVAATPPAGLALGDVVAVEGRTGSVFGERVLSGWIVHPVGVGVLPEPLPVTLAEAADVAFEGLLVTLSEAEVTDAEFTCDLCTEPTLYELGGEEGVVVSFRAYAGADAVQRRGSAPPITGVTGFRWERRLLMPRQPSDC